MTKKKTKDKAASPVQSEAEEAQARKSKKSKKNKKAKRDHHAKK